MSENYPCEKRKLVRFLISIPLKHVKLEVQKLKATCTHDISGQGLGVISAEQLPLHTSLILCLRIPDNNEELQVEAEAVWSMQIGDSQYRSGLKLKGQPIKPIPLVLRTIYSKL